MIRTGILQGRSAKTSRMYFTRNFTISRFGFSKGWRGVCALIPNKGLAYGIRMGEQIRTAVESHPFQLLDGTKIKITVSVGFQNMKNHRRNLFKRRMMRYTTRNEMVEIRSALYLKDKMTRRHKSYKNTHRGNV